MWPPVPRAAPAGLPTKKEGKALMRRLRTKLHRRSGFTLVEILVVVAIIAILVAVSIPLVTGSLDSARNAADMANERSARAAAAIYLLTDEKAETNWDGNGITMFYLSETNQLTHNADGTYTAYGQCAAHRGCILQVTLSADPAKIEAGTAIELKWVKLHESGYDAGKISTETVPPHDPDGSVPDPQIPNS